MLKPVLVLAFFGFAFYVTPSEGSSYSTAWASSASYTTSVSSNYDTDTAPSQPDCRECPGPNEVFDVCPALCPPQECGINLALILCPVPPKPGDPNCKPGCRCRNGFLRNAKRICVAEKDCPKCPKQNEVYDECPAPCPPRRCDVDERLIRCAAPPKPGDPRCQPGCRCADGFFRNNEDLCVTRDQCPKCTNPHEVYVKCPPSCPPQTCESLDKVYHCPINNDGLNIEDGRGVCRCEPGYYRNKIGECISEKDCRKCNGSHEYFSCGGACDNVCATLSTQNQTHCPIYTFVCTPKCYCESGYARNDWNVCIPIDRCKAPVCGRHEIYSDCINRSCKPKTCFDLKDPVRYCPKFDPSRCIKGCACINGYVRNNKGICIPEKDCPPVCGRHEIYSRCINRGCQPKTCSELGRPVAFCPKLDKKQCMSGCTCRKGYVRDNKGICIPKRNCGIECKANEVFSPCINGECRAKYCSQVGNPVPCVRPKICYPGCLCKMGWLRAKNGICVPKDQCTTITCGKHEIYSNCINGHCGPKTCSELSGPVLFCPVFKLSDCIKGCACIDGYVRDDFGVCIPKYDCPPICGRHEIYSDCVNGDCRPKTCSELGRPMAFCPKIDRSHCISGCTCIEDYARDDNNICIPKKYCNMRCGKNERFEECPDTLCTPQKCSQLEFPWPAIPCPRPGDGPCPGKPGCVCDYDFVRNDAGICIPKRDCHARCGKNERFEECPDTLCTPQKCSQLGFPWPAIPCPSPGDGPCPGKPGCVCDYDFVRNDAGICIPKRECPSCGGDPNAYSGCGLNCGRLCSNYNQTVVPCPRICIPNSCDCKEPYVFDKNVNKCVYPKDCTPSCGINEVYDKCANSGCRRWKCSQPEMCIDAIKCERGCVCKDKYSRSENGICIPEDQCDQCHKPHEYYDHCAPTCPPETCESIGREYKCPIQPLMCRGACRCEKGYYRNKKGYCVTEMECKRRCANDERYEDCPDNLCIPQYCSQLGFPLNCTALTDPDCDCPGEPGCICDDGKVRDDYGNCISKDQCPSCGGDPNAISGCGNCGKRCSDLKNEITVCTLSCPLNSCTCRGIFLYDENLKKCVDPKHCTPKCGLNEIYDTCANGGCRRWNCSGSILCIDPIECKAGCACRSGYSRALNGTCIPEDQCPENLCGLNERYVERPSTICEPLNCDELGFPLDCPPVEDMDCIDEPACICKEGYVRDHREICVPKSHCPSCGGDPKALSGCGVHCGNTCSTYGMDVACIEVCYTNACDCRPGFVYDEIRKICVLYEDCTDACDVS